MKKIIEWIKGIFTFNTEETTVDEVFMNFLIKNDALSKWSTNLKAYGINRKILLTVFSPRVYICGAFSWGEVPEGEDYWLDLNEKWISLLNKIDK